MDNRFCFVAIVRNESHVIKRCLDSIANIATSYVICDTGSTDNTPEIIDSYMKEKGIPGEVIHKEWKNYGFNKSYLLEQTYEKNNAKYLIWHDADEVFLKDANNLTSYLTKNDTDDLFNWLETHPESIFYIKTIYGNNHYKRWNIVRNNQLYKWISPKHEQLVGTKNNSSTFCDKFILLARQEGSASKDPDRCKRDTQLFLDYIKENGGIANCPREVFYLAQEYESLDKQLAIKYYILNTQLSKILTNWNQEVYISYLRLGRLVDDEKDKIKYWKDGFKLIPHRLECIFELMFFYRTKKDWHRSLKWGFSASENRNINDDDLFVESNIYTHDFDLDFSMAAYYSQKYELANNINQKNILRNKDKPMLALLLDNQKFFDQALMDMKSIKLVGNVTPPIIYQSVATDNNNRISTDIRPSIIIVDDFYANPDEIRKMALQEEFNVKGNYPGNRTKSFATEELKNRFEMIIGKKITYWISNYNGAYQYTTQNDKSWIHRDKTDYSAIIYLSPNPPANSGTILYKHKNLGKQKSSNDAEEYLMNNDGNNDDLWEQTDIIGNKYNRCILFDGKCSHKSNIYFGNDKFDGRLFQTFFFNTTK